VFLHGTSTVDDAYGVRSLVQLYGSAATDQLYGLHSRVIGAPATGRYGLFSRCEPATGYQSWAGWFVGNVHATGTVTWASDAGLKSNVEPLTNAVELLQALQPKRYRFAAEEFPHLGLPEGEHLGLIAQEVQEVLPDLVVPAKQPMERDEDGQVISPEQEYLSLNYMELVPLLIAGFQEQQAVLAVLQEQLETVQQQLAACCSAPDEGKARLEDNTLLQDGIDAALHRLLRVDPNPFTDHTTIRYTLERGGRTMLLVNSSDGKQLQVLHEAVLSAGEYQQEWHTSHLAPGIYYVTLLLDGEPLVKRAVKVR
jgi:hypothetical protein